MKTEWDLSEFYSSVNDPKILEDRKILTKHIDNFVKKWKETSTYLEESKVLAEALHEYEDICDINKEAYYLYLLTMKYSQDTEIAAKYNQATDFRTKMFSKLQFFEINISKISKDKQKGFLSESGLTGYTHYLEKIWIKAKFILSEKEETVLSIMGKTSLTNRHDMLESFLSAEEAETKTEDGTIQKLPFSSILSLMSSKDESVRKQAYDKVNEILLKYKPVAEKEINSVLEYAKNIDELRKHSRPDESRHISDDIDTDVVDAIIQTISDRYEISQKFYKFKAQLLGKGQLTYYERDVPYGSFNDVVPYEKGVDIVRNAFVSLDQEFVDIFDSFLNQGKIDTYPHTGKRGGGFCAYENKSAPIYVFLNYTNKVNDVTTLAHEMGHAINFCMMRKETPLNYGSSTSTAEVASTFMEDFALKEILKTVSSDEEKLALMVNKMDAEVSTIQRQIACYKFEQELHDEFRKVGYVGTDKIGEIFKKHMEAYMGNGVKQEDVNKNRWIHRSHIRYFFYVYSYASGLLVSKAMQAKVKQDKLFIKKVKQYLETGLSESPKQTFANMGIDITDKSFWNAGLDEQENFLNEMIALAKKLGKI